jgi:DNA-binding PadR family transcriptional regulator
MRGYGFHRAHYGRYGRERGERERGGRVFDQGDLRWVVLALIAERPRHGYEIIKEIEERVGGAYSPSPGVIYPTLTFLEETGLIAAQDSAGGRKLYALTPEGVTQLEAHRASVDALFERMSRVRERSAGGVSPSVLRALENLRMAVRLKLAQGPLSQEQAQRLAEAMDAAALAIERA